MIKRRRGFTYCQTFNFNFNFSFEMTCAVNVGYIALTLEPLVLVLVLEYLSTWISSPVLILQLNNVIVLIALFGWSKTLSKTIELNLPELKIHLGPKQLDQWSWSSSTLQCEIKMLSDFISWLIANFLIVNNLPTWLIRPQYRYCPWTMQHHLYRNMDDMDYYRLRWITTIYLRPKIS